MLSIGITNYNRMDCLFHHRFLLLSVMVVLTRESEASATSNCSALVNVTYDVLTRQASNQSQLDQFLDNLESQRQDDQRRPRCIQLSLAGGEYKLNMTKFIHGVDLKENDSLIVRGEGGTVSIDCLVMDSAKNILGFLRSRRLLNAFVVVFDGLMFTRCLLPIYVEQVSFVMIQNCVFR